MHEPLEAMESPLPVSSSSLSARSWQDRWWQAINGNPTRTFVCLVAFYLVVACAQASAKLLWCDELITLAVAHRGSLTAIWRALAAGADPNPPLMHALVMTSVRLFGENALAIRLPAILSVLVAIGAMWAVLRRWVSAGCAAVGVLAFMATRGFDYAYDARSYAPLMGFAMAALALWLAATSATGWRRFAALAGLSLSLALGLSSNYYGVLAFFPIAAGEIVLAARTRRFLHGAWVATAVAAVPLLAYLPLIRHNIAEFSPHAWNRPNPSVIADSYFILVEGVFWPVLGIAIYAVWQARRQPDPLRTESLFIQPYETTAVAMLLLFPILGYCIAAAGAGMISARCVAPVCCGFGLAAALLASRIFRRSARTGLIVLGFALVWVVARETACAVVLAQQRAAFFTLRDEVATQAGALGSANQQSPILVADSLFVLPLAHYSTPALRARIVFPIDFDAIHRFEKDDSGENNLWAGRTGVFPFTVESYDRAVAQARAVPGGEFLVIARPAGWLTERLRADRFQLTEPTDSNDAPWQELGGIFTPGAHEETRILRAGAPAP